MKPDLYTKAVLTIIAAALVIIAGKLVFDAPPRQGDFIALRDIKDQDEARKELERLVKAMPMVRIHGGQVDAEVTGTVSISD